MSNYYEPCFYRIDFDAIPSYIELPCIYPVLSDAFTSVLSISYLNGSVPSDYLSIL